MLLLSTVCLAAARVFIGQENLEVTGYSCTVTSECSTGEVSCTGEDSCSRGYRWVECDGRKTRC